MQQCGRDGVGEETGEIKVMAEPYWSDAGYAESEKGCGEASPKQHESRYSWKSSTSETPPKRSEASLKQYKEEH